jgi:serine/threonine protein phosphatase PrpC
MIKLTAITSEQEPHSTIAAGLVLPNRECHMIHAGDSRVYLFRGADMLMRTFDHSLVQRMVEQGELTEEEANDHPHSNLLTGCLGADEDPPMSLARVDRLELGDTLLVCSDGLWHYFTPRELGTIANALRPRDASKMLISKARQRARGGGDNLSLALVKLDALAE